MQTVRDAHRFWEAGLEHAWGDEPEDWLVEAVSFYHGVLMKAAHEVAQKQRPGVEEKPKGGGVSIRE